MRAVSIAAVLSALLAGAAPALASPIVYFVADGFGIPEADALAAAEGEGGVPLLTGALQPAAGQLDVTDQQVLTSELSDVPSFGTPNRADSLWSVDNVSGAELADAWLVFYAPLTYTGGTAGLELDPAGWGICRADFGEERFYYPAVRLGDLADGASAQALVHHVVAEELERRGLELLLPQYAVGVASEPAAAPEPGALVLLGLGLGALAFRGASR